MKKFNRPVREKERGRLYQDIDLLILNGKDSFQKEYKVVSKNVFQACKSIIL